MSAYEEAATARLGIDPIWQDCPGGGHPPVADIMCAVCGTPADEAGYDDTGHLNAHRSLDLLAMIDAGRFNNTPTRRPRRRPPRNSV